MYRFTLLNLILLVAVVAVACGWVRMFVYVQQCETHFVPVHELKSVRFPRFLHDRMLIYTPAGVTYEAPFDPVSMGILVLFTFSVGLIIIISIYADRSRE